jgi:hypothetical protein
MALLVHKFGHQTVSVMYWALQVQLLQLPQQLAQSMLPHSLLQLQVVLIQAQL